VTFPGKEESSFDLNEKGGEMIDSGPEEEIVTYRERASDEVTRPRSL